ncbi:MAG TPA: Xaa-Pro peptidase family protein [Blastocatellia bacterium]|nr:Xaa-Pro peptidase family protein [Blastocatellia bacterium]
MHKESSFRAWLPSLAVVLAVSSIGLFYESARSDGRPPAPEYKSRRQKLLDKLKDGVVVLLGAREEDFGEVGRFRQNNYFMYVTGVDTPAAYVMLVPEGLIPGKPAQETVFVPPRNLMRERWTGVQIGPGPEAEQRFGVQEVASSDRFMARLIDLLTGPPFKSDDRRSQVAARLYTIVPRGQTAALTRENQFVEVIKRAAPHVNVVDVSATIDELRKVKSPAEIELLQKAIDITGEAQHEASQQIRTGAYEYEVQGALEYAFTRNGAERPGFPSIVGSGINSTVLHYNENRKKIDAGDLVVVDIGAEYGYYSADITRTYPASGKFTARQREVYQLVLDSQRAAEKAFKPGETTLRQLQQAATDVMRSSSVKDKNGNTLERYFIHGLGHWLGMDVHDVGDYSKGLPPGSVITIEPGVYIPEEKLGVRIEDDYLVTGTGLVKMSSKIPSEPDEIERLMSKRRTPTAANTR